MTLCEHGIEVATCESCHKAPRFVWVEPKGIWDNQHRIWVVWRGIGQGWYTTDKFRAFAMLALNEHSAMEEYDR